ncbi:MAG: hypothetical protein ACTS85_03745 [Arsenophonus sp. NC-PG7-MAG3]
MSGYLDEVKTISERYYFILLISQARRLITNQLPLVSNAAQTLHPITGQWV